MSVFEFAKKFPFLKTNYPINLHFDHTKIGEMFISTFPINFTH